MIKLLKVPSILFLCCVLFFVGCNGSKKKQTPQNVYEDDIIYSEDFLIEDEDGMDFSGDPYPMGVDNSFDDFVFAYAANPEFQKQRTRFPLPIVEETIDSVLLTKDQWVTDTLFTNRKFYTILYDCEDDMELAGDPDIVDARIEWIYLVDKSTKFYNFKRSNEVWMLESISKGHLEEYLNEEFIEFYSKFVTDSLFQLARLHQPLVYVTHDPQDDFEIIESEIDAEVWKDLNAVLPEQKLVNINYGQSNDPKSKTKILAVNGIGYGFSNVFFFKLNAKEQWELYRFEDLGV